MKISRRKRLFKALLFYLSNDTFENLYRQLDQLTYFSIWYKGIKKYDIVVFDDVLPNLSTPWRSYELENLILKFPNSKVVSNDRFRSFSYFENFEKRRLKFQKIYPSLSKKILKERIFCNVNSKVLYFLFFKNVVYYYRKIEVRKIPFVFTLYPGGGWELNNQRKDELLVEIISNRLCLAVIVNQFITYEYLVDKLHLPIDKIKLIHGVPFNMGDIYKPRRFNPKKGELKIVFVGHKYTKFGEDKGLPIFLGVIRRINEIGVSATGYVVGDFRKTDLEEDFDVGRVEFLGELNEDKLLDFLSTTDIILSSNQPFILSKGAYDGFPLGSVGIAALCGNLVLSTDYFEEGKKIGFFDKVHFLKITTDIIEVTDRLIECLNNPDQSSSMIQEAWFFLEKYYSFNSQIGPRLTLFNRIIAKN